MKKVKNPNRSKNVLIMTPMIIENATKSPLYSFFRGLKYVFRNKGTDNICKNALSMDKRYKRNDLGASKYQNRRKIMGSERTIYIV